MSWLSDRTGIHINSINDITSGRALKEAVKNPLVLGATALALPGVGGLIGKGISSIPGISKIAGAAKSIPGVGQAGSAVDWLTGKLGGIEGKDWLSALGAGAGAYLDSEAQARQLAEAKRQYDLGLTQRQAEAAEAARIADRDFAERVRIGDRDFLEDQTRFGRTQGNTEAQLAVQAETALNKAPMADQAQALLRARMGAAPTAFAPRDITRGTAQFRAGPTGGPSTVTAAMQNAVAAYKPGQGGVDTSALKMLKQRMLTSSGGVPTTAPGAPTAPALAAQRAPLMLPATTDPLTPELLARRPQMGVARRPARLI